MIFFRNESDSDTTAVEGLAVGELRRGLCVLFFFVATSFLNLTDEQLVKNTLKQSRMK